MHAYTHLDTPVALSCLSSVLAAAAAHAATASASAGAVLARAGVLLAQVLALRSRRPLIFSFTSS